MNQEPEGSIFDHIFAFFRSASETGATWGEPWGVLFPLVIVVILGTVVVSGFHYTADRLTQQVFKPILFGVVILCGLYIVASLSV